MAHVADLAGVEWRLEGFVQTRLSSSSTQTMLVALLNSLSAYAN